MLRCTEADAISWHDSRRPRSDRQLLRALLEVDLPHLCHSRAALSVFATALAMLDKVHLLVIKRFNDDGSLRGPSLQEILAADRAVWQAIHSLIRDHSWSLSDSLNEVAFCRQDIPSALQPRPRAVHVPNPRVNLAEVRSLAVRRPRPSLLPPPPSLTKCRPPRPSTSRGTKRSTGSRFACAAPSAGAPTPTVRGHTSVRSRLPTASRVRKSAQRLSICPRSILDIRIIQINR